MNASKKCSQCGKWSPWNQNSTDRCAHCQSPLDLVAFTRQQVRQEQLQVEKQHFPVDLSQINPGTRWVTRLFKKIEVGFQLALMAIVSFFIWFIALLAA